jgi:hypothetical protein
MPLFIATEDPDSEFLRHMLRQLNLSQRYVARDQLVQIRRTAEASRAGPPGSVRTADALGSTRVRCPYSEAI